MNCMRFSLKENRSRGIFRRARNQPTVPAMMSTFYAISRRVPKILAEAGTNSLFDGRAFQDLCYQAKVVAKFLVRHP